MDTLSKLMNPREEHGISRLTLGEIGNRVSAITIDTKKGGAVKKEILQPIDAVFSGKNRAPNAISSSSTVLTHTDNNHGLIPVHSDMPTSIPSTAADHAAVKVEWMPGHNLLHQREEDMGLLAGLVHPQAPLMDISDDGDAFSKAMLADGVEDVDAEDSDNPQLVSLYVKPIYSYMRQLEKKFSIRPNYLEGTGLTGKMRAILIDWLCQVHGRFHLLQETLHLTVAIIDRYLQVKPCTKNRLQLVGVTAMLVASKYEEMYTPEVADFVYITDNAYTKKEVRDMEQDILRTLDFSFGRPLCLHFLRRYSKAGKVDATKHTLAKYLMELTIVEMDMVHIRPSHIAASALYLSMLVLDGSRWTKNLQFYSCYSEEELIPLAKRLAKLVLKVDSSKFTAVKTKYSASKFMKIAVIPQLKSRILLEMAASEGVPVS
ncbi:G2/mitotic-specific cyclin-B2 [Elysia marginata]|uniref:G2/mitotic-specific cyclin-B2 n=1 Tax=Elysia marginata TaxID=1093978 RepID=A0AAV4GSH2_9GAST|nr:G2/mitotic-specific cyclin-B2 [Elysia marginata]